MADSPFVVNVTTENFRTLVLDGSHERPVLVDFWADWCAPCRMLMPLLAGLADEYAGKFIVAKVNTEEERELASEYGIRSLPTVQLFKGGQAVEQFMGALPESQIREFLDRHLPRESDNLLTQAQDLLSARDPQGAAALVEQARLTDGGNPRIGLLEARIKAALGDTKAAEEILGRLPIELKDSQEVLALKGQLRFANLLSDAPPEADLAAQVAADPADSEARHRLAAHRVARSDFEGALDQLLEIVKKDRGYGGDAGRKGMLMIFGMLGGEGELVSRYRGRMLNALY
ncbi:MAG: thioredoxin [Pseudomonadota bacterium]|nr:thioredoxin [Pseudomonadota bacterium]